MPCGVKNCTTCYPWKKEKKVPVAKAATVIARGSASVRELGDSTITLEFGTGTSKTKVEFDRNSADETVEVLTSFLDK